MSRKSNGASFPVEILENIFSQVPFFDLIHNCTVVCKRWNDIIKSPKFLPWKKTYHKLTLGFEDTQQKVQDIMDEEDLRESPESLPQKLCVYVKQFRKKNPALLKALKFHSKYDLISSFLHSTTKKIRKSPWSIIVLLTIVSTSVRDITEIIWIMMSKNSNCLVIEILELLYLLASIFWMMKSEGRINSGLHYRIIYACHLFERTSVVDPGPSYRRTSNDFPLTHEQMAVVNHELQEQQVIKIVAFAGTGKTSTLVTFARQRPEMKFLNVSYNKSIQLQAEKVFPYNVESRTIHSLAFAQVGRKYRDGQNLGSAIRSSDVQRILSKDTTFIHAERVTQTVKNFLASSRHHITVEDVTKSRFTSSDSKFERYFSSEDYKKEVVRDAKMVWKRMTDLNDRNIYMTHDGYLKLYQMSRPSLHAYDCILVDEAQDITPAIADILLSQRCPKILVGDPHQQIYAFRGAENALDLVESSHTYYLTQSFRFGEEIGYIANSLLEVQKDYHRKTLVGTAKPGGVLGDTVGQLAIICRSNFGVFSEASRLCRHGNDLKVAFAGGLDGYNLNRVMDIYNLQTGNGYIRDPLIKRFKNYKELCKFVCDANDKELASKIKIVEHFGANVPIYIESIQKNVVKEESEANVIVSTAHKAKGLQFSSVRVHDDFSLIDPSKLGAKVTEADIRDESNLLYVAVTRAQNRLILNKTIIQALGMNQEYLLQPITGESFDRKTFKMCILCYQPLFFEPVPSLLVEQPEHVIFDGEFRIQKSQGLVCRECTLEKTPYLHGFLNPKEENTNKQKKKKDKKKKKNKKK